MQVLTWLKELSTGNRQQPSFIPGQLESFIVWQDGKVNQGIIAECRDQGGISSSDNKLPLSSEFEKMNEGIVMEFKESSRIKKASQAALNKDMSQGIFPT